VAAGRSFDALMARIEASAAVVSKDEPSSRVWQGGSSTRTGSRAQPSDAFINQALSDGVLFALRYNPCTP